MIKIKFRENFLGQTVPAIDLKVLNLEVGYFRDALLLSGKKFTLKELFKTVESSKKSKNIAIKDRFKFFGEFNSKSSSKSKSNTDFEGIYLFSEGNSEMITPIYVGISRRIIQRLRQHAYGKDPNQSTFSFLMAKKDGINRAEYLQNEDIRSKYLKKVRSLKVFIYPYDRSPYELQLMEVLIACHFNTYWNSFRTH